MLIKFHWNIPTPISLSFVYGCLDREIIWLAKTKTFITWSFREKKSLPTLDLNPSSVILKQRQKDNRSFVKISLQVAKSGSVSSLAKDTWSRLCWSYKQILLAQLICPWEMLLEKSASKEDTDKHQKLCKTPNKKEHSMPHELKWERVDLEDRKGSVRVHLHFFSHKNLKQGRESKPYLYKICQRN